MWLARFTLVLFDATLWPSKAALKDSALQVLGTVVAMSGNNMAHVQMPIPHAATTPQAVMNHSRSLEDSLIQAKLDLGQPITLIYRKDDSRQSDKRRSTQQCWAALASHCKAAGNSVWMKSNAVQSGYIDGLPLVKVVDMMGQDENSRLSPGLRVEQMLVSKCCHQVLPCFGVAEALLWYYIYSFC